MSATKHGFGQVQQLLNLMIHSVCRPRDLCELLSNAADALDKARRLGSPIQTSACRQSRA